MNDLVPEELEISGGEAAQLSEDDLQLLDPETRRLAKTSRGGLQQAIKEVKYLKEQQKLKQQSKKKATQQEQTDKKKLQKLAIKRVRHANRKNFRVAESFEREDTPQLGNELTNRYQKTHPLSKEACMHAENSKLNALVVNNPEAKKELDELQLRLKNELQQKHTQENRYTPSTKPPTP